MNLEELFTAPHGFDVPASPLQRAICRLIEGLPLGELAAREDVLEAMGDVSALEGVRPLEIDILSGIRTGKTRLAACLALHASQVVDLRGLRSGEIPRISILSLTADLAVVAYDQLVGAITTSPVLRKLLVEDPAGGSVVVRHPSGRPVEIRVVAGARAGGSLVARWSAGAILDEAPRMLGSDDGAVVNFDDARRAVLGRLLPGAQIISIGSPWAPLGPIYERCMAHWKKPTREVVVVRAPAPAMNPTWWTPERCAALQRSDNLAYTTDVCAEFSDPESAFITATEIRRATREGSLVLPSEPDALIVAAIDAGTRGNSWPLCVVQMKQDLEGVYHFSVLLACQWTGTSSMPLSPVEIFAAIERKLRPYGQVPVISDQHSADALLDIAARTNVRLKIKNITSQNRAELFERVKGLLSQGTLELPAEPVLLRDLASVRRRVTQSGLNYHLPKTPDGRHADYFPALMLALSAFGGAAALQSAEAYARKTAQLDIEIGRTWLGSDYQRQQARLADLPEQVRVRAMRIHRQQFGE